jgi:hypothetical protein
MYVNISILPPSYPPGRVGYLFFASAELLFLCSASETISGSRSVSNIGARAPSVELFSRLHDFISLQ